MNDVAFGLPTEKKVTSKNVTSKTLKAVIFDCDGVLVDSEPVYAEAFSSTLAAFGFDLPASLLRETLQGKSMADCYAWLAKHWGFSVTAHFEKTLLANTDQLIINRLQPIDHAAMIVAAIRVPKAVASNGLRQSVLANLKRCQLDHFFGEHIYTADQVAQPKPAPDIYLLAAKRLGVLPTECAVVEDSPLGVAAAVAAGMQVCWLNQGTQRQASKVTQHEKIHSASSMQAVGLWLVDQGLMDR
ncbi:HAD family hydrolase [Marinagarivorans algicola]|uniref:HAD family hydrolase n=1 Tax=Marinagarivorans algicola TaxID=1513270 RepID=UPI0006B5007D|nr:HAD family phosphatase [Marinagarivorans algicola]